MTLLGGALALIFGLVFGYSSPETSMDQSSSETVQVFERFKTYLDQKIESLSTGLVSQTTSGTQKLERIAEAEKLKFAGNKDQFIFNSELQGTLDETVNLLTAQDVERATEKSLHHRQKIIKLADKSEAGWLAVKEYRTEDLASDSDDEKRIKKAQERALKKKKQNASKRQEKDRTTGSFPRARAGDDRMLFRGINLFALSLNFQRSRQFVTPCLPYNFVWCHASAFWIRKMLFPSYERSEGEGKESIRCLPKILIEYGKKIAPLK